MKKTKYFESQQDDEEVVYIIRRHWFTVFFPSLAVFILYIIGFLGIFLYPHLDQNITAGFSYNIYVIVISLIFLFTTAYLFHTLVFYYLNVVLITNEHIVEIKLTTPFARKISELEFGKVQDVASKEHGIFQSLLNFGDVEIQTAGENRNFLFKNVPNPSVYAQEIMELEEKYRNERGITIEPTSDKKETELSKSRQGDKIEKEPPEETLVNSTQNRK